MNLAARVPDLGVRIWTSVRAGGFGRFLIWTPVSDFVKAQRAGAQLRRRARQPTRRLGYVFSP